MSDLPHPATLALAIRESAPLLLRFLEGFEESNRTVQTPGCPNHAAWTLGHCAYTMARTIQLIGGPPPCGRDFSPTPTSSSFRIDDIVKDSTPRDDPTGYPSLERSRAIFCDATEALAHVIESRSAESLTESVSWGDRPIRIDALIVRLCFHNGMHAGQLTDLRRSLGFARVLPLSRR